MQEPPPPPPPPPPAVPAPPFGYQRLGWTPPPPVSRRRWWFWGCGGCAAIALLAVAVVVFVAIRLFSSSPLRQFPTEAGASVTQDHFQPGNNLNSETLLIVDPHSISEVEAYYQKTLHANGWNTETHDPTQARSGDTWRITRPSSPGQNGSITFTTAGSGTEVAVAFNY